MSNGEKNVIEISQLSVNYGKRPILWDISMGVPSGKLVGLIGPNGAGKTTLLKALLGFITPFSGHVTFFNQPLAKVRQRVAYVPQRESVDWDFPITVRELVVMGRYGQLGLFRQPRQADWSAVDDYLEKVGMASFAHHQIGQLSGGQQQRVFLARALIQRADIYLMDEPFVGIDQTTRGILLGILQQLRDEGKTIVIVHHDLNQVKLIFNWVILLNLRLIACGKVDEIFNPNMLQQTFGDSYGLLDEVFQLSQLKSSGIIRDS